MGDVIPIEVGGMASLKNIINFDKNNRNELRVV